MGGAILRHSTSASTATTLCSTSCRWCGGESTSASGRNGIKGRLYTKKSGPLSRTRRTTKTSCKTAQSYGNPMEFLWNTYGIPLVQQARNARATGCQHNNTAPIEGGRSKGHNLRPRFFGVVGKRTCGCSPSTAFLQE